MHDEPALETTVLVPADAVALRVVSWSSTDPHAGVRATMVGPDGEYPVTIETIVRAGERFSPTGSAHGVATDARTLAATAVVGFLAARTPTVRSEADRAAARDAVDAIQEPAEDAASAMHDASRWSLRPVHVDGTTFVLHVHGFPDGFAAFADLGPEVLVMGGSRLPEPLLLHRRRARGRSLLPEAAAER